MRNITLPIIKNTPKYPKLEWIRKTIYPKQGGSNVRNLHPQVGAGGSKPDSKKGEILHI
jgi:hypothetical protein